MPRKLLLKWDKSNKYFYQTVNGRKIYLCKGRGKWNKEDYEVALGIWNAYLEEASQDPKIEKKIQKKKNTRLSSKNERPKHTLAGIADRFLHFQYKRARNKEITVHRTGSFRWAIKRFLKWVGPKQHNDDSAQLLNRERIEGWKTYLDRIQKEGQKEKRISAITANDLLLTIKMFAGWAYDFDYISKEPKYLRHIKKFDKPMVKNPEIFTVEQVRRLFYEVFDSPVWRSFKIYILLGLNCGFGTREVATLCYDEIDFENRKISKFRTKTGVYSEWFMWDITYEMLKHHKEHWSPKSNPIYLHGNEDKELVFRTSRDKPLMWQRLKNIDGVNPVEGSRFVNVDSVAKRFKSLRERTFGSTEDIPTFRHFRKTGATLLADICSRTGLDHGHLVARLYLSHSPTDIFNQYYYNITFENLRRPLKELEKVFDLKWEPNKRYTYEELYG
tara:strand:+ start:958 stop:2289 length:1332 start_codon:yes stop_codon:yes gene_type:complete